MERALSSKPFDHLEGASHPDDASLCLPRIAPASLPLPPLPADVIPTNSEFRGHHTYCTGEPRFPVVRVRNSAHDDARCRSRTVWTATCVACARQACCPPSTVRLTHCPPRQLHWGGWRNDGHGRRRSRPPAHGAACHAAWDPAAALIPPVALVVRPEPAGERQSYSGLDVDSRTGRRRRRSQSLGFSGVTTHHTRRRDVKCPLKTAMTRPS